MVQRVLLALIFFYSFLATADDTVLKLYRPFGEVINQMPSVVKSKVTGQCYAQSQLIVREDAWRCMGEGKYFDPCFVKAGSKKLEAVCPLSPWVGDSVQINVSVPLNNDQHITLDMSRTYPWAIELVNGERCLAIATSEVYDSMPVRYRCHHQNVLIGYLQRCKSLWSMLEKTSEGVRTVDLAKAWF